jgi:hypothetical protein
MQTSGSVGEGRGERPHGSDKCRQASSCVGQGRAAARVRGSVSCIVKGLRWSFPVSNVAKRKGNRYKKVKMSGNQATLCFRCQICEANVSHVKCAKPHVRDVNRANSSETRCMLDRHSPALGDAAAWRCAVCWLGRQPVLAMSCAGLGSPRRRS